MYSLDTVETNLLEFLVAHGYDVWLVDHRLSVLLPSSTRQSRLDDVAVMDYPATVAAVRARTGRDTVQVVSHGVGSSTLTMALLSGLQGVRSAVCSQVSTHLEVSPLSKVEGVLRVPSLIAALGVETLTADVPEVIDLRDRLSDGVLKCVPLAAEERCDSMVCHRITGIYGLLYEHDQLGATHDVLEEIFAVANLTALRQLALLGRVGHLVDAEGKEVYLPQLSRLALPILLLSGAENVCVRPASTETTLRLLREHNGADLYRRYEIPGYGHLDCIIGQHAARDVYPYILEHLEAT
jgi:cholesterol oxidase